MALSFVRRAAIIGAAAVTSTTHEQVFSAAITPGPASEVTSSDRSQELDEPHVLNATQEHVIVTKREADEAVDMLRENPEILVSMLPSIKNVGPEDMLKLALKLVNNPKTIALVHSKVREHNRAADDEKVHKLSMADSFGETATADEQWEQLCSEFSCSLCKDVLAAPVILPCSHSFCGECVYDMMKCTNDVCEVDPIFQVHSCPNCREGINHKETYQREFDYAILRRVESMPECDLKTEYHQRRDVYLEREKMSERASKKSSKGSSTASTASTAQNSTRTAGRHFLSDMLFEYCDFDVTEYVPYVVFAVICIATMGIYTKSKKS